MENKQTGKKQQTVKKVLHYLGKYKLFAFFSLLCAAATAILTLYLPILIGDCIDYIVEPGKVDFATIFSYLKQMALVIGATAVAQWLMNTSNNKITYSVVEDIRKKAFHNLERLPLKYLDSHQSGDIISRIVADVDQFSDGLLMGFTQFFTGIMTIFGTLFFMIRINGKIALVVICITPLSLLVASYIAKKTYTMFQLQSEARGEMTSQIDEMIGNQKVVQAFSHEAEAEKEFYEINEKLSRYSLRAIFFSSITNPSTRFVNSVVYTGVGITGAISAMHGGITVGQLSCFLSYANQYTKPFNEISGVVTELQNALTCAARVFEFIEEEPQIPDEEDALVLEDAKGKVELSQVDFSYQPEKPLIENLNLSVEPGQRIAIVGPTGCGKTTLINLLMRFYDVDGGSISVDGTDIRKMTRGSLRTQIGMVLQDTWLKNGTIRENLLLGKEDATDEEMF